MNYEKFEDMLKKAGLNKKEFSYMVDMSYTGVTNWKQVDTVPSWVYSWLENYIKAKAFDNFLINIEPFLNKLKD